MSLPANTRKEDVELITSYRMLAVEAAERLNNALIVLEDLEALIEGECPSLIEDTHHAEKLMTILRYPEQFKN